jgi:serine phosphatase RsbU (regulator of sigma subunit)
MARSTSIRRDLLGNLLLVIALLGGAIIAIAIYGARETRESLLAQVISQNLIATEVELNRFFGPVESALRAAAAWGDSGLLDDGGPEHLNKVFQPIIREFPQVSSLLIADDTGSEYKLWRTGDSWQTREVRRSDWAARARWHTWADDGSAPRIDWIDADYDPRHQPWFRGALRAQVALDHDIRSGDPRRVFWSEPYTFFNTGDPGITASMPFGDVSGRRRVIAFDIRLRDISRFTSGLPVSGTGSVAVLTRDNRLIGVPRHQRFPDTRSRQEALLKRPTELGWVLAVDAQDAFTSLGSDAGPVRFSSGHEAYWGQRRLFPLALARALWIVVVVPERDILGPLLELRMWVAAIVAVVVLVAILRAFVLSRRYSRPMEALVQESNRISLGDLDEGMAIGSKVTEIRQLAEAHERMREGLRSLMRIEDDLKIARRIQQNTLPGRIPYLPHFDIDAFSESAEETGGDIYDVVGYRVDGDGHTVALSVDNATRALLLLADATGHGVGPALSATQVRAMLRMAVRTGADLEHIVVNVNEQLCDDLFGGRFITAWLGIVDAAAGTLTSFSAGQAPLFHYHAAEHEIETILADGPPFGVERGMKAEIMVPRAMEPGDFFAVFSDGILESINADGERFGEERAREVILAHHDGTPGLILTRLRQAIARFSPGVKAGDDRTAVVIKRERT